jgi:hexokinase
MIIITEWAAFGDDGTLDFLRTDYDRRVDKNSINPGRQMYIHLLCSHLICTLDSRR